MAHPVFFMPVFLYRIVQLPLTQHPNRQKQFFAQSNCGIADGKGWMQRLVDLNHQRAAEETQDAIRYLRPEFQDPEGTQKQQVICHVISLGRDGSPSRPAV